MTFRYVIPDIPPSNNRFIGRADIWEYRRIKKDWEQLVLYSAKIRPREPLTCVNVCIRYFFPDKKRRDPDNYSGKMILDGLRYAGIIKDDCFGCITLKLEAFVDREKPRLEILVSDDETEQI